VSAAGVWTHGLASISVPDTGGPCAFLRGLRGLVGSDRPSLGDGSLGGSLPLGTTRDPWARAVPDEDAGLVLDALRGGRPRESP
jgi:hypothetical protein